MTDSHLNTKFAPAERAARATIDAQAEWVQAWDDAERCFDAVNDLIVVLNPQRQIVFANQRLVELLGLLHRHELYGLRPGEAMKCIHADAAPAGCGTSEHCCQCGAVNAIMTTSLLGHDDVQSCTLHQTGGGVLDLLVRTTPVEVQGQAFTISAITPLTPPPDRDA